MRLALNLSLCAATVCAGLLAQTPAPIGGTGNNQPSGAGQSSGASVSAGLAMTPPMGWNTWNKFGCNISEEIIRAAADTMASSGMRDAGYQFLVIDDCWHGARDAHGDIQADPKRFPSGVKALADYVHSKGLQFGIYSDAGDKTCAGRPASRGFEYQDAAQYARWGVDYLKYDWCNTGTRNAQDAYTLMRQALDATGRPIVFSLCEWGTAKPWLWAAGTGNLWRTTGDIADVYQGKRGYQLGMMDIVDLNEPLYSYGGPGHWNDPDMLEIGNGGMTTDEYRTHFALWSMMAAPLIAGNDLTTMSTDIRSILLNKEVIAIDQDPLGVPGRRVRTSGTAELWTRDLHTGERAVALVNRDKQPATVSFRFDEVGYPDSLAMHARDLWAHRDSGPLHGSYSAIVPAHGTVLVVLKP